MPMMIFLLVMGFWGCCLIQNAYLILSFAFIYSIFLYFRFKKLFVQILWIGLCILSCFLSKTYVVSTEGNYTITSIKANYCLASNGQTTIVLYDIEQPGFGDVYDVSSFEKIHSLHNIHQFSFQEYMNHLNIYEQASSYTLVSTSNSIQSKLYSYFSQCDNASYYLLYLYGIYDETIPELFSRLSIPLLTTLAFIEKILNKKWKEEFSALFCIFLGLLFGYLFTFKMSLIRYLLFKLGKVLFKDWEYSFSFSLGLFCLFYFEHVCDFSLVFPVCIQLVNHFTSSHFKRTLLQSSFCIAIQFYYFHEVDIGFVLFYSIFRSWNTFLFITSLFCPFFFSKLLLLNSIPFPSLTIHYVPGFLFSILLILFVLSVFKSYKTTCMIGVGICMLIFFHPYINPFFHIYMIDVGQGDCTLIVEPFKKSVIMIDVAGNLYRDNVIDIILPVLNDLGIDSIDYLIITHDDFDHNGGKDQLIDSIEVKNVITDYSQTIDVDYPLYLLLENRQADDENERSLITYFSYDSISYLWMGDASVDIEKQLLANYSFDVDVLKLGHHGSNTSSSYDFLDSLRPVLGLISVGYNNSYNHPSNSVIVDCESLGINILKTSDVGMIHIISWHSFHFFVCSNGLIGTF